MKNIANYIEKVEQYVNNNPDITEDELIRYVYLDLGKRLSFNLLFTPFGNSRERQEIYRDVYNVSKVDKCLENGIVICNTASRILEIVLKHFNVCIKMRNELSEMIRYPHVYNSIIPKDGREEYSIDLQADMYYIQMNGRTPNYGLSMVSEEKVISYYEQEQMDRKLGYISDNNYYTDDFLYTLKMDISYMHNLYDILKFILENIEVCENPNMGYIDRQWYHVRILEYFFNPMEFDYRHDYGRIKIMNCYKKRSDNTIIYINGVVLEDKYQTHIFLYNKKRYGYVEIDIDNFVQAIIHGLVIHNQKIKEIQRRLRKVLNNGTG